jgi:hypothetical protein
MERCGNWESFTGKLYILELEQKEKETIIISINT